MNDRDRFDQKNSRREAESDTTVRVANIDSLSFGLYDFDDVSPGTIIEGFKDIDQFVQLESTLREALIANLHLRDIYPESRVGHKPLAKAIKPKGFHGKLVNPRAIMLDFDPASIPSIDTVDIVERFPAFSTMYLADMISTGRGVIGTAMTKRDILVTEKHERHSEPYFLHTVTDSRFTRLTNETAREFIDNAKQIGRVALAEAMMNAFRAGAPGTGRKRK